jgi:hypothetical protein
LPVLWLAVEILTHLDPKEGKSAYFSLLASKIIWFGR